MENKFKLTLEQQDIVGAEGNVVVTARPGSGKTFTIVRMIEKALKKCYDYQGIIAISFTKKASRELELRCRKNGISKKSSFFGTIDHFYITEIIIPFAKHLLMKNIELQIEDNLSEYPQYGGLSDIKERFDEHIESLLLRSLEEGHVFLEITGETAFYILQKVNGVNEYLKSKYTHIYIDEYQDCGEIQHKIFMYLIELGMKGVAVGDLDQAIFAFTNRYAKYLELLLKNNQFQPFSLSKNYRCHESIVNYSLQLLGVQQPVPNEKRIIEVKMEGSESDQAKRISERFEKIKIKYGVTKNSDVAILCRNKSSAEIISKSLGIKNKLFIDNKLDISHYHWSRLFGDLLRDYFDKEIFAVDLANKYADEEVENRLFMKIYKLADELFNIPENELKDNWIKFRKIAYVLMPEYECEEAVIELKNVLNSKRELEGYRSPEDDEVCIMTLHKSKGLEFDIVFHMDLYDWTFPKREIDEEEWKQTLNLHYVGITRAKKVCYIVQGTKRYRAYNKDYVSAYESPFLYLNNVHQYRDTFNWKELRK